jgi:hypothetical protein
MPICPAHEVALKPVPRCPVCGVGVTASGRNQPIAVDANGRPYCRAHGNLVTPEFDLVLAEYERTRKARAALLRDAQNKGVKPTANEIATILNEWQQPA